MSESKNYYFTNNSISYLGMSTDDILLMLGDVAATSIVKENRLNELKRLAHTELLKYDWMYVREYRMANSAAPMPVPEHIATHYEAVRQWVDQQELLLASMTIEQLEAHEFIVPTL